MQSNSSDGSGDDISLTSLSLGPSESPTTSVNSTSPGDIIVTTTNDEQSSSTPVPTADNQIVGRENSQTFHAPVSSDPQTGSEPSTTCQVSNIFHSSSSSLIDVFTGERHCTMLQVFFQFCSGSSETSTMWSFLL